MSNADVDTRGPLTRTVSEPMSVTVKVSQSVYVDGPFDGQNGFQTYSVRQIVVPYWHNDNIDGASVKHDCRETIDLRANRHLCKR